MRPIPVTNRLPDPNTPQGDAYVLAYEDGTHPGWVSAVYNPVRGWAYSVEGVSGYKWELADIGPVTHWMPWPPKPDDVSWKVIASVTTHNL